MKSESSSNVCLATAIPLLSVSLFLVSQQDQNVFEDGNKVHEEGKGMPHIVLVS